MFCQPASHTRQARFRTFGLGHMTNVMTSKSNIIRPRADTADMAFSLLLLATVLKMWPTPVFGIGFRIPNQDAEAIARGNAFVATADNPSAIYYNPAGITQLEGHNAQIGVLNYL